jgi:hypothetical protein
LPDPDSPEAGDDLRDHVLEVGTYVTLPQERKFLGFSFTAGPKVKRVIAPKALDRFKRQIREITRRAKSVSIETTMAHGKNLLFKTTKELLAPTSSLPRYASKGSEWKVFRSRRHALIANARDNLPVAASSEKYVFWRSLTRTPSGVEGSAAAAGRMPMNARYVTSLLMGGEQTRVDNGQG